MPSTAQDQKPQGSLKRTLQLVAPYLIAIAIIAFLARNIPLNEVYKSFSQANLWIFIPASVASFLCWYLGETLLFSRLFSYFHQRTTFRELLPVNGAQYFLQVVNMVVAGGAWVLFLHRRKQVPWLAGGYTLLFQNFVDWFILASMGLLAALLVPESGIATLRAYALGALCLWLVIAAFWLIPGAGPRVWRWFYDRPSLVTFRQAELHHYFKLACYRTPLFVFHGIALYAQLISFHVIVPMKQVLAFTPAIIALGGIPITPVGMGPLQAILMTGFMRYGSQANLLAMALAISIMHIVVRIPLGLGSAGAFAREVTLANRSTPDTDAAVMRKSA